MQVNIEELKAAKAEAEEKLRDNSHYMVIKNVNLLLEQWKAFESETVYRNLGHEPKNDEPEDDFARTRKQWLPYELAALESIYDEYKGDKAQIIPKAQITLNRSAGAIKTAVYLIEKRRLDGKIAEPVETIGTFKKLG
jgi:hypothetical protein